MFEHGAEIHKLSTMPDGTTKVSDGIITAAIYGFANGGRTSRAVGKTDLRVTECLRICMGVSLIIALNTRLGQMDILFIR